ncbi:MAG TPA: integrase [Bradyrhizobium sp.]|nr:integrase [Bradyrhizobium sp.]
MVAVSKLRGLQIFEARGKWYVYRRATGEVLIKGLVGDRKALDRHLETPEFLQAYNKPRLPKRAAKDFGDGTLGALVHWFSNGDIERKPKDLDPAGVIDEGYPGWSKLSKATRDDYLKAYRWLADIFDAQLSEFTTPELYDLRDKCAVKKKTRFADKMIRALSSMFKQGVKRGKMERNPCLGMDRAHEADPDANREWYAKEWNFVLGHAPLEVLIPMMAARHIGLRGQTIVSLNRKQIEDHPEGPTGKAVRYVPRKNRKRVKSVFLPVMQEMQDFLAELKVQRADGVIAVRDDGSLWPSEKEMQTRVSHWLRDQERAGHIGAGTTLHGLRVSYAAWWKRNGASDSEVAALIGDVSDKMGKHYTRHVEAEISIIRAFDRLKDKQ